LLHLFKFIANSYFLFCCFVHLQVAGQIIFKVQIILLLAENQLKEIELDDR